MRKQLAMMFLLCIVDHCNVSAFSSNLLRAVRNKDQPRIAIRLLTSSLNLPSEPPKNRQSAAFLHDLSKLSGQVSYSSKQTKHQAGGGSRRSFVAGGAAFVGASLFLPSSVSAESSGTLPVEFNELDPETADILLEDNVLKGKYSDNVFAFRGGKLLRTNREGALRYFARCARLYTCMRECLCTSQRTDKAQVPAPAAL
jgi:hypothetical protein